MKPRLLIIIVVSVMFGCSESSQVEIDQLEYGTVVDFEGNVYKTVQIGTQVWMAENIRSTKYANGVDIPLVEDNEEWASLGENNSDKAYCFYNNNENGEKDIYGALYTFAAAVNGNPYTGIEVVQGVCPDGWHVPSSEEWDILEDYFLDSVDASNKLKEKGNKHWKSGNEEASNESGFTAIPGGYRYLYDGSFGSIGYNTTWWTSTENTGMDAYARAIYRSNESGIDHPRSGKSYGYSVRCVKD